MTIVRKYREYEIDGERYFVEQYADKPHFVWLWRYGKCAARHGAFATVISGGLWSRPNLKRLKSL